MHHSRTYRSKSNMYVCLSDNGVANHAPRSINDGSAANLFASKIGTIWKETNTSVRLKIKIASVITTDDISPPPPRFPWPPQAAWSWGRTPSSRCSRPPASSSCPPWSRRAAPSWWSSSTRPTAWASDRTPTPRAATTCRGPPTPTPWWVLVTFGRIAWRR